ncbi:hypothetical protein BAUCODRAFT_511002 [Baudoinia panamericana UAMH 10762]|uniref:Uncharacterized protein n=1 Tax=Baudoinia panamericana (strain UAMH 10762) TaxID=717646 RepID=M2NA14_BAUPA|nr:uncharacterized protein BAUCODRAFT_511002 [Baudoinia panamericana UAMH 10762]EMC95974.1 hypothetical protein BAUCODRAFT_511002 [Baudoinia panamericana UAMH 10762]
MTASIVQAATTDAPWDLKDAMHAEGRFETCSGGEVEEKIAAEVVGGCSRACTLTGGRADSTRQNRMFTKVVWWRQRSDLPLRGQEGRLEVLRQSGCAIESSVCTAVSCVRSVGCSFAAVERLQRTKLRGWRSLPLLLVWPCVLDRCSGPRRCAVVVCELV